MNNLTELNDALFAQLNRLSNDKLTGEALRAEIERSRAVNGVAAQIINIGSLVLEANKEFDMRDTGCGMRKLVGDFSDEDNG